VRRRVILKGLGITTFAHAHPVFAQLTKPLPQIGILMPGRADDRNDQVLLAALRSGLAEVGWTEAETIHIEYRWGNANDEGIHTQAAELVRLAPRVIVTVGAPAIVALKQVTSTIPIVFAGSSDPVEAGLVTSLSHPGGNVTGFSHFDYAYATKWVECLKQLAPEISRLVIFQRPADPSTPGYLKVIGSVAPSLGLETSLVGIVGADDIEPALDAALHDSSKTGLLVLPDLIFPANAEKIVRAVARLRVPATYPNKIFVAAGGLMSYSTDRPVLFHRTASYVDRILRGEKPGDLPVQSPTKFELAINLKTANALGLAVPQMLFALADQVIE